MYKPYVIFSVLAVVFGVLGLLPFVRYAVLKALGNDGNHLQSLLLGTVLLVMSFMSVIVGIIGDLLRTNRALIEDTLEHTKKLRFGQLDPHAAGTVDLAERRAAGPLPRRTLLEDGLEGERVRTPARR
jgi:hypothetical protein